MSEKEFNLLEESWIRVMTKDCRVEEVSLAKALVDAHNYRSLAGELPTQDAAVFRLLLAVLHAVFERVNINGEDEELKSSDDALERWESLWRNEKFPEKPLTSYFEGQKENFWLFHPTKPFWQRPVAKNGSKYEAKKLNGSLSESGNKVRLFSERAEKEKNELSFAEAARWLLYVNAYDDKSAKATNEGKLKAKGKLPSLGAGWLGEIGYVCVTGTNLFETLMLNFVLLDNHDALWKGCKPAWELEKPRDGERTEIPLPRDQAALLTLQSRRLLLNRVNDRVVGYGLLGGDFFQKENALSEQMTVWGRKEEKNNIIYYPKRHDKSHQMWRDFASYMPCDDNASPIPGVIRWNMLLQKYRVLPVGMMVGLSICAVVYGDKGSFATDIFSDSLSLNFNLLSDLGKLYRTKITEVIGYTDKIAENIGLLGKDLFVAAGGDTQNADKPKSFAKEQYYFAIDVPFRRWLSTLDANDDLNTVGAKVESWREQAKSFAHKLANEMVKNAGKQAFVGKTVIEKEKKKYYSSSLAMQSFEYRMKNIN